ncbi:hypothetical protein [Barnesiella intestinihominis]|uniref:hypothetical protein n=1 Tax=Barnesiella intestinihominis TaxID=487174 RepID=UPI0039F54E2C
MIRYLIFPLFLLGSLSSAFSQVRGIVKDIAGEPIIGANVFWLGTTTGTTICNWREGNVPFREIFVLCDIGLFYYIIGLKR